MGCVYKEVAMIKDGKRIPKIKLSNDIVKTINPDFKDLYRAYDKDTGYALADIMVRHGESVNGDKLIIVDPINILKQSEITNYDLVPLQKQIFKDGNLVYDDPTILEKRDYCEEQMNTIYPEVKREMNPHTYYVDGTLEYVEFKNDMIKQLKKEIVKGDR